MTLDEMLQPGNKVRHWWGSKTANPMPYIMHIRAIVDGDYIVYKQWSPRRQSWRYLVDHRYLFKLRHDDGTLEYAGRSE